MTTLSRTSHSLTDLRRALKRGRAREAFGHAATTDADMAAIVRLGAELRPNPRSLDRVAQRLARLPGVVRVSRGTDGGLVVLARCTRQVVTRTEGVAVFTEEALLYTRVDIMFLCHSPHFGLLRASFCLHALERLVERSQVPLDCPLLPLMDAEAGRLLRRLRSGELIVDADDQFVPGGSERNRDPAIVGVWAGALDKTELESGWGLIPTGTSEVSVFSVRTFLGPDQMRPALWLKWNGDPALSVA
jgi:hypothetical protein